MLHLIPICKQKSRAWAKCVQDDHHVSKLQIHSTFWLDESVIYAMYSIRVCIFFICRLQIYKTATLLLKPTADEAVAWNTVNKVKQIKH